IAASASSPSTTGAPSRATATTCAGDSGPVPTTTSAAVVLIGPSSRRRRREVGQGGGELGERLRRAVVHGEVRDAVAPGLAAVDDDDAAAVGVRAAHEPQPRH